MLNSFFSNIAGGCHQGASLSIDQESFASQLQKLQLGWSRFVVISCHFQSCIDFTVVRCRQVVEVAKKLDALDAMPTVVVTLIPGHPAESSHTGHIQIFYKLFGTPSQESSATTHEHL